MLPVRNDKDVGMRERRDGSGVSFVGVEGRKGHLVSLEMQ